MLTAACIKTGRPQIARRAIELAESRLLKDSWPEYYDGKLGRYVGKQARKFQTWSIAGYLVAKMMLEDPSHLGMISLEEDKQMKPVIKRSASWNCWRLQKSWLLSCYTSYVSFGLFLFNARLFNQVKRKGWISLYIIMWGISFQIRTVCFNVMDFCIVVNAGNIGMQFCHSLSLIIYTD